MSATSLVPSVLVLEGVTLALAKGHKAATTFAPLSRTCSLVCAVR